MRYKDLTQQQVAELIAEYKAGVQVASIWQKFNLNAYNFYTLLSRNHIEVTRTPVKIKLPTTIVEQVISKYKAGSKTSEILFEFNISTTVLYSVLDENGISRRLRTRKNRKKRKVERIEKNMHNNL